MYYTYEQWYIELMEQGKHIEAIAILQKQLVPRSPFGKDKSNLFKLAQMIMKKPIIAILDCSKNRKEIQKGLSSTNEIALDSNFESIDKKSKMELEKQ